MDGNPTRIALFVDGPFYQRVFTTYLDYHPRRAPLSMAGLLSWCRSEVARRSDRPLSLCRIVEARSYWANERGLQRERGHRPMVEQDLVRQGFTLVTGPPGSGQAGLAATLGVDALSLALRGGFDVAVVLGGSAAMSPVLRGLAGAGVAVLAIGFDLAAYRQRGRPVKTPHELLEEAAWPVLLSQSIDNTRRRDPVIDGLFLGRSAEPAPVQEAVAADSSEPTSAPASVSIAGKTAVGKAPAEALPTGRQHGTVVDLRGTMGFVREDRNNRKLFFHHSALQDVALKDLQAGDRLEYEVGLDPQGRPCALKVARVGETSSQTGAALESEPSEQSEPEQAGPASGTDEVLESEPSEQSEPQQAGPATGTDEVLESEPSEQSEPQERDLVVEQSEPQEEKPQKEGQKDDQ